MPIIRKMTKEEYLEIANKISDDEIEKIAKLLLDVLKIYKSKRGTYEQGYWKAINERRIESSIACIKSLLEFYYRVDSLTPAQIELAKKMIKNGFLLL